MSLLSGLADYDWVGIAMFDACSWLTDERCRGKRRLFIWTAKPPHAQAEIKLTSSVIAPPISEQTLLLRRQKKVTFDISDTFHIQNFSFYANVKDTII